MTRSALLGGSLVSLAWAAQPGAIEPVAAPMRNLTWGQLNFLHTTDTHGWLGGHFQEPQYSADWGDYISFSHHMRKLSDDKGSDLLVIDTGDRVEGNGLYDASTPKGLYQYDIFAEQDVDVLCTGNHELYKAYSALREHNTTTINFKDNYVASNLDYINPETGDQSPMAQRYRRFTTKNQEFDIVAMGFLFDFTGNANNTVVQPVEEAIKTSWFQDVIKEKPDVFVIIGHVGLRMEEFEIIFKAIRKENWHTPIAFFGGHAHVRDAVSYDSKAFAMASGRYLETIGWMSIDGLPKKTKEDESIESSPTFTRKYIDNNLYGMYHHTGLNATTFPTEHGKNVSQMIDDARQALDLDHKFGCAPQNYWMARAKYPSKDSIYSLLEDQVLPDVVVNEERKDKPRVAIVNSGGIRFDIFKGPFTKDSTFIVSPFTSGFKYIPDVPFSVAKRLEKLLNSGGRILENSMDNRFLTIPEAMFPYPLKPHIEEDPLLELRSIQEPLEYAAEQPEPIGGYTTVDDIGDDGDDTVHKKLDFYAPPNVIQAEIDFPEDGAPANVDVVFIDFIQPWIIPGLKFSGGDYNNEDVQDYMEGTVTSKLAEWISKNWAC
ncbi:hypothetical protein N3K66_000531 [Trichothecium roseum]|uniref:Uncharacterized protein n=1 Tax=Trichothecium roseum TaxID=47278 RepID=A0ACC0VC28_9HYPO|nr:hypothetical protein N3K66_000531 [Trichothecium roseum]